VLGPVSVDELDDHHIGRSRSAPKKADALSKIAFALRSSRTSRYQLGRPSGVVRGRPRPVPFVDPGLGQITAESSSSG
jgi:hypothetical protein